MLVIRNQTHIGRAAAVSLEPLPVSLKAKYVCSRLRVSSLPCFDQPVKCFSCQSSFFISHYNWLLSQGAAKEKKHTAKLGLLWQNPPLLLCCKLISVAKGTL